MSIYSDTRHTFGLRPFFFFFFHSWIGKNVKGKQQKWSLKSCLRQTLNANHIEHISTWGYEECACACTTPFFNFTHRRRWCWCLFGGALPFPLFFLVNILVPLLCLNSKSSGHEYLQRFGGTVTTSRLLQTNQLITDCAQDKCFVSCNRDARKFVSNSIKIFIQSRQRCAYDTNGQKEKSVKSVRSPVEIIGKNACRQTWTNLNNWYICFFFFARYVNKNRQRRRAKERTVLQTCNDRTKEWIQRDDWLKIENWPISAIRIDNIID